MNEQEVLTVMGPALQAALTQNNENLLNQVRGMLTQFAQAAAGPASSSPAPGGQTAERPARDQARMSEDLDEDSEDEAEEAGWEEVDIYED